MEINIKNQIKQEKFSQESFPMENLKYFKPFPNEIYNSDGFPRQSINPRFFSEKESIFLDYLKKC